MGIVATTIHVTKQINANIIHKTQVQPTLLLMYVIRRRCKYFRVVTNIVANYCHSTLVPILSFVTALSPSLSLCPESLSHNLFHSCIRRFIMFLGTSDLVGCQRLEIQNLYRSVLVILRSSLVLSGSCYQQCSPSQCSNALGCIESHPVSE